MSKTMYLFIQTFSNNYPLNILAKITREDAQKLLEAQKRLGELSQNYLFSQNPKASSLSLNARGVLVVVNNNYFPPVEDDEVAGIIEIDEIEYQIAKKYANYNYDVNFIVYANAIYPEITKYGAESYARGDDIDYLIEKLANS